MQENIRTKVYNFLINDYDFKMKYIDTHNSYEGFKETVKDTVYLAFDFDSELYLDKAYLDIAWLKVKDKLINLDLLWDIFINNLKKT